MRLSEAIPTRCGGFWGADAGTLEKDARAIRNGDVGTSGELRWNVLPMRGYTLREFAKARVHAGDIVITTSGNCGNVAYIRDEPTEPTLATNFVRILRTDQRWVHSRYAYYFMRTTMFASAISPFVRGATIKNLSLDRAFEVIEIPLPPLDKQRRIVAILDQADALRAKRRQVLAHLDSLTQSIFNSTIGSERWLVEKLGDRLDFLTSGSRGWAKYYAPSGDKFIRIQNVKYGRLNLEDMAYVAAPATAEARRAAVHAGDVLLSITADLGRTAVIPNGLGAAYVNQHLAILRAPSLVPRYLADFLESPTGRREVLGKDRGATKAGLNFDDVRSVLIPIPPLDVQLTYESQVARVDAQRAMNERAAAAEDKLFSSLQARAFSGGL